MATDRLLDLLGHDGRYLAGALPARSPEAVNVSAFAVFACDDCDAWWRCGRRTRTERPCFACGGEVQRRLMVVCHRCGATVGQHELTDHLADCEG